MAKMNSPQQQQKAPPSAAPTAPAGAAGGVTVKPKRKPLKRDKFVTPDGATYVNEEGKFTAIPTDFDRLRHKPLIRADFADESVFYEMKALEFEQRAKRMRHLGEESKKLGNVKERGKAKKLLQLQKRFEELKHELAGTGLDVEALLASLAPAKDAEPEAEKAAA